MVLAFESEAIEWRGPAPYVFIPVPPDLATEIKAVSSQLSYGWGCIEVTAQIGETEVTTALFPKFGGYLVPVKAVVQRAEGIGVGDRAKVRLTFARNLTASENDFPEHLLWAEKP